MRTLQLALRKQSHEAHVFRDVGASGNLMLLIPW